MRSIEKILVADDDPQIVDLFAAFLCEDGYEVIRAADGRQVLEMFNLHHPDLIFIDVAMPELDGLEVLRELNRRGNDAPVIVFTGHSSMDVAVRAIKMGAYDYMTKPLDFNRIRILSRRCLAERRLKEDFDDLRETLSTHGGPSELVGSTPEMLQLFKSIGSLGGTPNETCVLIKGENGTGKELAAQQVHLWGNYSHEPFVTVYLNGRPARQQASEMFGFEKGAFIDAAHRHRGKFERAGQGTVLLDEIGELSKQNQPELLDVLNSRQVVRIGGERSVRIEARVISSTSEDLEGAAKSGDFNSDLCTRLSAIVLHLPALRDRLDDLPILANHITRKFARQLKRDPPFLTGNTIDHLCSYYWPGNVRELKNVLVRAMTLSQSDQLLPDDIPLEKQALDINQVPIFGRNLNKARQILIEKFEKKFTYQLLRETNGNVTEAASIAGINRQSFHRLMKKHRITSRKFK